MRFWSADDHEVVRSGLRSILEAHEGWQVVADPVAVAEWPIVRAAYPVAVTIGFSPEAITAERHFREFLEKNPLVPGNTYDPLNRCDLLAEAVRMMYPPSERPTISPTRSTIAGRTVWLHRR